MTQHALRPGLLSGSADDSRSCESPPGATGGAFLLCAMLLWISGAGLRITILAVPPLIRLIHEDLALSETQIGILTGLPPVLFGLAAVPGALLITRLGVVPAVVTGLLATALGCALRSAAPDFGWLCAATVLTGIGVAVMQPAMPPLVRTWLPHRISLGTAVYTNGLLIGEILPVALTIPLVLPLAGGSWRLAFVVWALPCAAFAALVLAFAPPPAAAAPSPAAKPRWMPDWRSGLIWRLGLMLGVANATYFSTNAFLPDYLDHLGRPDLIGPALSALNLTQLPASLMLLVVSRRFILRPWCYMACGALSLTATAGIVAGGGFVIVASAGALGFSAAAVLVLLLTLPPLLSEPGDTHRMTAGMFTISYGAAMMVPIGSGLAWDGSGVPAAALIPIGLCNLLLIALAPAIRPGTLNDRRRAVPPR